MTQLNNQRLFIKPFSLLHGEQSEELMIELSVCTGSSMSKLMVCCGGDRAKVACGCSSGKARSRGAPGTLPLPQCCLVAPTFLLPSYLHPPPQRSTPPDPPQSTEHCDWLYGIFGHETSCTRYWTCWNGENPEKSMKPNFVQGGILMLHIFTLLSLSPGTATEQFCIGGLLYNEETHACDWPQNVAGCQKHREYFQLACLKAAERCTSRNTTMMHCSYSRPQTTI